MPVQPVLGQIMPFAGRFAPRGWAFCNGALLSIAQNQGLFSLLGTYYGGNGVSTFALPDLRGRAILGSTGGGGAYPAGMVSGVTTVIRAATTGGVAPAAGCNELDRGRILRVEYTADYYFYAKR